MGNQFEKFERPPQPPGYSDSLPGLLWVHSVNSKIPVMFYEWKGTGEGADFTILYSGDCNEDLGALSKKANIFKETFRSNIVVFDYPGYGLHAKPSEVTERTYFDTIRAVFGWLTQTRNIPHSKIVFFGSGIGTGPLIQLASELYAGRPKLSKKPNKRKPDGPTSDAFAEFDIPALILQSPMVSLATLESTRQGADPKTPRGAKDVFINTKKVAVVECPVLIAHGVVDTVISVKHSRKLSKHVTNLWQIVEVDGVEHADLEDDNDFVDAVLNLLSSVAPAASALRAPAAPKAVPNPYKSPQEVVQEWLSRLGLAELAQLFIMGGFIDMDSMMYLDKDTLTAIGIASAEKQELILRDLANRKLQLLFPKTFLWDVVLVKSVIEKTRDYEIYRVSGDQQDLLATKYALGVIDRDSFCAQAASLFKFKHSNILLPYAVCLDDNVRAILFPAPERGNLASILQQKSAFVTDSWRYGVVDGILEGLRYLHSLTPPIFAAGLATQNIYFAKDIRVPLIGCLDHLLLNRQQFVPPECRPLGRHTAQSDVFLLGTILLDLLRTACKAWSEIPAPSFYSAFFSGDGVSAPADSELFAKLFEPVARKCLRDAAARITAEELATAIEGLEGDFAREASDEGEKSSPDSKLNAPNPTRVSKSELLPAAVSSAKLSAILGAEFSDGRTTPTKEGSSSRRGASGSKELERREVTITDSPESSMGSNKNSPSNVSRKELVKIGSQQNLRLSDKKSYRSRSNRKSFTPGETDSVLAQMADRKRPQSEAPRLETLQEIRRNLTPGPQQSVETESQSEDSPSRPKSSDDPKPTDRRRPSTDRSNEKPIDKASESKTLKEDVEDISSTIDAFLEQQLNHARAAAF